MFCLFAVQAGAGGGQGERQFTQWPDLPYSKQSLGTVCALTSSWPRKERLCLGTSVLNETIGFTMEEPSEKISSVNLVDTKAI